MHSLESVNFLKIEPNNCVSFDMKGDSTIIQIENQYMKKVGEVSKKMDPEKMKKKS